MFRENRRLKKLGLKRCTKCAKVKGLGDFSNTQYRCKECSQKTPIQLERRRNYYREYGLKNPGLFSAYSAKYYATKAQRTPHWADLNRIRKVYLNRPKGDHVDHVIPLKGGLVSGLHVHTNLQYLEASLNQRKSNRFTTYTEYPDGRIVYD